MFSRTSDILNYARLSKASCSHSFFNSSNDNNNSSTSVITIMIIIMLMIIIMIMAIAIPMGIVVIMVTITLLLNEMNVPFAAGASFLKVPIINGPRKAVCCFFSR